MNQAPKSPPRAKSRAGAPTRLVLIGREATPAEVLHARVAPAVSRVLWTLLGADPDRDDLAQEIFLRILRGASSVCDPARLEKWAVRVAVNSVKNEFRRRSLRRWLSLEPYEEAEALRYHPDFEGRELVLHTQRVLEQMPTRERIPLSLRLIEGASTEELAQLCGCSVRTVKRRLKSAQERFLRLARRDPILADRLPVATESAEGHDE